MNYSLRRILTEFEYFRHSFHNCKSIALVFLMSEVQNCCPGSSSEYEIKDLRGSQTAYRAFALFDFL